MSMLSPRFLALPVIALAVIVGLANAQSQNGSRSGEIATSATVVRAVNCALPSNVSNATCAVAGRTANLVR